MRYGAIFAMPLLSLHLVLPRGASLALAALLVPLIAGVYIVFALRDGRHKVLAVEVAVAGSFLLASLLAVLLSPWILLAAYLLHGVWDLLHPRVIKTLLPTGCAAFCCAFDWTFALGFIGI